MVHQDTYRTHLRQEPYESIRDFQPTSNATLIQNFTNNAMIYFFKKGKHKNMHKLMKDG